MRNQGSLLGLSYGVTLVPGVPHAFSFSSASQRYGAPLWGANSSLIAGKSLVCGEAASSEPFGWSEAGLKAGGWSKGHVHALLGPGILHVSVGSLGLACPFSFTAWRSLV